MRNSNLSGIHGFCILEHYSKPRVGARLRGGV
jgi:hypothetical protein